jgi:hypothetical protein
MQFISKDIPLVHLNPAQAVFFQIISVPTVAKPKKTLRGLLKELNFYLLSINILANVAQKNGRSPTTLLKRWNNRHSKVLDGDMEKRHSLSDSMQLSLSSPSVQNSSKDGCLQRTLRNPDLHIRKDERVGSVEVIRVTPMCGAPDT